MEESIRCSCPMKRTRIELIEILAETEDDVKNGRVAPISETFNDLRAMLLG